MGSVASRPSAGSGERYAARLLTGIEEADTEKVAKAIKKGADIQRCTLPGELTSAAGDRHQLDCSESCAHHLPASPFSSA